MKIEIEDAMSQTRFDDIAGYEEQKDELREIIDYMQNPEKYMKIGARIPRGIILEGNPGTGKTLMARAVAGEAKVPFYNISGVETLETNAMIDFIRDVFKCARAQNPAVIFIDELDRLTMSTMKSSAGYNIQRALLMELDGFSDNHGIIVLGAVVSRDDLDNALIRPGRFDRIITLFSPDAETRTAILNMYAKNKPLASDIDMAQIAKETVGFTGAELETLMNESAMLAVRQQQQEIHGADIEESIERIRIGTVREKRPLSKKEKRVVSVHESGHLIAILALYGIDFVVKASIVCRGGSVGHVSSTSHAFMLRTQKDFENDIAIGFSGLVAEETIFGHYHTGVQNDLDEIDHLVSEMIFSLGMSSAGALLHCYCPERASYSPYLFEKYERAKEEIVNRCLEASRNILSKHADWLDVFDEALQEKNELSNKMIAELIHDNQQGRSVFEQAVVS